MIVWKCIINVYVQKQPKRLDKIDTYTDNWGNWQADFKVRVREVVNLIIFRLYLNPYIEKEAFKNGIRDKTFLGEYEGLICGC